jgi:hypothetical protein
LDRISSAVFLIFAAVTVFTGKPTGGEDRKLVFSATTGALVANEVSALRIYWTMRGHRERTGLEQVFW